MDEILDGFLNLFEKDFPWRTDADGRSRRCWVRLYARTISAGFSEHWALHFDWGDHEATYEANDKDGYLIPTWNNGPPEQICSYDWRAIQQITTTCSPREVNTKARTLSDSGKTYILTKRNCHTWAVQLAAKLGISLEQSIEKYLPRNVCDIIDLGHCLNNLFSESLSSLSSSSSGNGGESTSTSNCNPVSAGRLATAAAASVRNREALATSSRVSARSSQASSRTATSEQSSEDGSAMVASGLAMVACLAINSFLGGLEDSQTRTSQRKE